MNILKCKVWNIGPVIEAEFAPKGKSITIGGANEQGKSWLMRGLVMALVGKKAIPDEPVRRGCDEGGAEIDFGDYLLKWEVDKFRNETITLKTKEGIKAANPRKVLEDKFGPLSFDPGAFKTMPKDKRFETLRRLCGLDFSALTAEYAAKYAERTAVGRTIAELEGKLKNRKLHEGVPEVEQSAGDLVAQIDEANRLKNLDAQKKAESKEFERQAERLQFDNVGMEQKIKDAEALIKLCRERIAGNDERIDLLRKQALAAIGDTLVEIPDTSAIEQQLRNLEAVNAKVRENQQIQNQQDRLAEVREEREAMTRRLEEITATKARMLGDAKFPIAGLGLSDDDVTFEGIAWDGLSESRQWAIACSIGFALSKKSIVFISQSCGMDKKSRAALLKQAEADGCQALLEVVDDCADVQIVIEAGRVKEDRLEAAA